MSAQAAEAWIPADTFGMRLVMIRREKGLTVEQAAKAAGIAHPTWSTWERGAHPRDMAKAVAAIATALGVNRDWLMWGATSSRLFRSTPSTASLAA